MSKLYLECNSGISGDMTVAALLDAGADEQVLRKAIASLPLSGYEIRVSRVKKMGLDVCDFDVVLDEEHENHDHDMEYLYGHEHAEEHHGHDHHHDEGHDHEEHHHDHDHAECCEAHDHHHEACCHHHDEEHHHEHDHGHGHHHVHRGMKEVTEIVEAGELTPGARALALRIFTILGQAEAKAHGETMETVHFHEVGAVDSIVDIVSAAVCLDNLGITDVIVTSLAEGQGTVRCAHGILPIPVPAVSNIVTANGLSLHITDRHGELVTPTGAAIAAAIRTSGELPAQFTVKRIGIGAGKREYEVPSLVRAMLIEDTSAEKVPEQEKASEQDLYKLESNIDDCSGEMLGYVMERLLAAGARDVYYTPIFMKKNRPAYQLGVICDAQKMAALENIIFLETTTIGIRRIAITRSELQRHAETVITEYGTVKVKVCTLPEGAERVYPEYESVAELARQTGIPFKMIYDAAACS